MKNKKRVLYLDVMRTVAVLIISLNHAVGRSFENYDKPYIEFAEMPHYLTFIKALLTVFSHLGVPLFLMITGALLLNRNYDSEEDLKKFYRKNYLGLLITSEIWYFIIFWLTAYQRHRGWFSLAGLPHLLINLVKTLLFIDQTTFGSLWYIPLILCIYLMLPGFSKILHSLSIKAFVIPGIIVYLSGMIFPTLNNLLNAFEAGKSFNFALKAANLHAVYFLYILAGYWLSRKGLSKIKTAWLWIFIIVVLLGSTGLQYHLYSLEKGYMLTYNFPLLLPIAMCMFELIRRSFSGYAKPGNVFTYISVRTFAIYFIHVIIMEVQCKLIHLSLDHRLLYLMYLWIPSLLMSLVLIKIGSQNKWVKKYALYM